MDSKLKSKIERATQSFREMLQNYLGNREYGNMLRIAEPFPSEEMMSYNPTFVWIVSYESFGGSGSCRAIKYGVGRGEFSSAFSQYNLADALAIDVRKKELKVSTIPAARRLFEKAIQSIRDERKNSLRRLALEHKTLGKSLDESIIRVEKTLDGIDERTGWILGPTIVEVEFYKTIAPQIYASKLTAYDDEELMASPAGMQFPPRD